jgi:hypothetical protein
MSFALAALLLTLALPEQAPAAACPPYRQDRPLRCSVAYVHLTPGGLLIPLGDVHSPYATSPRLGYTTGVGVGAFRAHGRFGIAAGARFGYGFTRQRFDHGTANYDYLHVGPELRLGGVTPRVFAFGLVRAGYSRWHTNYAQRLSIEQSEWAGGHIGVGVGAWGHLGGRFLLGGEAVVDFLFSDGPSDRPLALALVLGVWL